ncbi:TPA: hypothetical protein DCX15_02545 [bacterium]|nr:hypothetical protein [bacterium]
MPDDLEDLEKEEEGKERLQDDGPSLKKLLVPKPRRKWLKTSLLILILIGAGGYLFFSFLPKKDTLSVGSMPPEAKVHFNEEEAKEAAEVALTLEEINLPDELYVSLPQEMEATQEMEETATEPQELSEEPPLKEPAPEIKPVKPPTEVKVTPKKAAPKAKRVPSPKVKPQPSTGNIVITSIPSSADVYLNGVYKGKAPITLKGIEAWEACSLKVTLGGYKMWTSRVFTGPKETTRLKVILEPLEANKKPTSINSTSQEADLYQEQRLTKEVRFNFKQEEDQSNGPR